MEPFEFEPESFDLADFTPEGGRALGFVISLKYMDADGGLGLVNGYSDGVTAWEAVGMAQSAIDDFRAKLQWIVDDDG